VKEVICWGAGRNTQKLVKYVSKAYMLEIKIKSVYVKMGNLTLIFELDFNSTNKLI